MDLDVEVEPSQAGTVTVSSVNRRQNSSLIAGRTSDKNKGIFAYKSISIYFKVHSHYDHAVGITSTATDCLF